MDKELKKLSRMELLEMLLAQTKRVEELEKKLAKAEQQLQDRRIDMANAGSLAEMSAKMSGLFEVAQETADLYLENIRRMEADARKRLKKVDADRKNHREL